jgi:D-arabinose 1-dehydrogenase-like Zn-dependent alcohol dehydrogenase
MSTMRVVQVAAPNGPLKLVEREVPQPGAGAVRVKVQACGICHSDSLIKEGHWPGVQYPRVPGHEIAGTIDAVGPGVVGWTPGQRVGIGWCGGYCGHCDSCRRGDFITCQSGPQIPGLTYDGGYGEYMIAPAEALALIPEDLSAVDAAPLMCAGITTFNALRHSGAQGGDTVAVLGLGGLGHLAVQYAAKMGFKTVAVARGQDKRPLAQKLGAWRYIDSAAGDVAAELVKLGGAKVIVSTVTSSKAMSAAVGGLGVDGKLVLLGVDPTPIEVPPTLLIMGRRSIVGWPSGTSVDSEDTLAFSVLTGVRAMTEVFPLERAAEAYERMMSGNARFRVVLTTGQ